jgi:hypothetical protein
MRAIFAVRQLGQADCGPTALKMLIAYLYQDERYLFLQETWDRPSSFQHLLENAQHLGVTLKGYRLHHPSSIRGIKAPFLALMKQPGHHYVTLIPIGKGRFHLLDPQAEPRLVKVDFFQQNFTGYLLLVKHWRTNMLDKIPMQRLFFPGFFLISISGFIGILTAWFWQQHHWVLWLGLAGIGFILWGYYVYQRMRYLDRWMIHHYLPLIDHTEQFKRFHEWKSGWLRLPLIRFQHWLMLLSMVVYVVFAAPGFLSIVIGFHLVLSLWLPKVHRREHQHLKSLSAFESKLPFPSIPTRQFHQLYQKVYHHLHLQGQRLLIVIIQVLLFALLYHQFVPMQAFLSWATMVSLLGWSYHHHLGLMRLPTFIKQWRQVGFTFLNASDYVKIKS